MQAAFADGNGNNKSNDVPQFLIVDYHPLSKTLVAGSSSQRPLYDYAYRVDVRNSGGAVADLTADVTSKHKAQQIIRELVHFGAVAAKRTQPSTDTFIVRANCHFDSRLDPLDAARKKNLCGDKDDHDEDDQKQGEDYNEKFNKLFDWKFHASVVAAVPKISANQPLGIINQSTPVISAAFQDAGGGIAPTGALLSIDGKDVSPQVAFANSGFSYQPATPLADGLHQINLSVPNLVGNLAQASWTFTVDTAMPSITGMAPKDITTANPLVPIGAQFADVGTGIEPTSIKLTLDGVDVTAQSTQTTTSISYLPTAKLGSGDHVVQLALSDRAGNSTNVIWHFTIDLSGPVVSALQPANNTVLPADAVPTISAAVAIPATSILLLELDGQNITAQAQVTASGVSYTPRTALSEGSHTVKLSVTDQYGNLSVTTWAFITRTPPVIGTVAPKDITLNAQTPATLTAQYSDVGAGVDPSKTILLLDNVDVTAQAQISATGFVLAMSSVLPEGVHIVSLSISDLAGNSAATSWRFTVYTGLPVISGLTPQDVLLPLGTPTITAQYQDSGNPAIAPGINTALVKLLVDGVDVTASSQVSAIGISYISAQAMADGLHTVKLSITDKAANTVTSIWSFVTDTGKPTVATSFQPADGSTLAADALPIISAQYVGSVTGVDTANVYLELDGVNVTSQAQVTDIDITYTPTAVLSEGAHTVVLSVPNKAGTVTTQTWSFKTATPPAITYVAPQDVTLNIQAPTTLTAQYTDIGSGVDASKTMLMLDNVDVTAQAQISATGLVLSMSSVLPEGVHIATLNVTDKAGNTTTQSWHFTVYAGAPVISGQAPQNVLIPLGIPTITAQYLDSGDPAIAPGIDTSLVKLLVDGVDVTAAAQISASGITYTPAQPLMDGSHTVTLSVTDKAANSVSSTWNFVTDMGKPIVSPSFLPADGTVLAADALPTISALYQETLAGIDTANVTLQIDGQNVTTQAQVTDTGITYNPAAPLNEGLHTVILTVPSKLGAITTQTWSFKTATPPVITAQSPMNTFVQNNSNVLISASFSDVGSGVDVTKVNLQLDGIDVTAQAAISATGIQYTVLQALPDLTHQVTLVVADKAGNATTSNWQFITATPPQITATTPKDVLLPPGSIPTISANFVDSGSGIDVASVSLLVNGVDVTGQASINAAGISYTPTQALPTGPNTVNLIVSSKTNASTSAAWSFTVDVQKIYNVTFTSPAGGQTVTTPKLAVTATAYSNATYPSHLTLNGIDMNVTATAVDGTVTYSGNVNLIDGINTLAVVGTFADGSTSNASTQITYDAPGTLVITSPADKATLGPVNGTSPRDLTGNVERPVTITGHTSKPVQSVTINQQVAILSGGGTEFSFPDFFLHEGNNLITAVGTDSYGRVTTASVIVSVDQTAPFIAVESPLDSSVTSGNTIDLRGTVNDAVEGYYATVEPTVTVTTAKSSVTAQVADKQFLAAAVPLELGENTLNVTAIDQLGNTRSTQMKVIRVAAGSQRLTNYAGNAQSAMVGIALAKPLTVAALDKDGSPLANTAVTFDISRGTGTLYKSPESQAANATFDRNLVITTDANGLANVWLTLGKQSGPGSNAVHATAANIAEDITFIASGEKGPPKHIRADLGINQYVATGTQPLEPLTAVLIDDLENRIPNTAVTFTVVLGEALFENGTNTITVNTDKNGYATARPVVGATPGEIIVQAIPAANADNLYEATFTLHALEAKDGPTQFSGVLMNDKGQPLAGARMSIGRTALSTTVDDKGLFTFDDVPPGKIDLFVDGRTVNIAGQLYPSMHFEATAVKGASNRLPHPLYMPQLLMAEAKIVGGDQDVILHMPGFDGYEMTVFANSVTFPDGSKTGPLVVSPISLDKLPMTPPGGYAGFMAPAATLQPSGTRFDPPVRIKVPNSAGFKPGEKRPVYQWDFDLAVFVPMGQATVTDDGAFLITDPGTGISKAGWHPIPNPPPPDNCPGSGGAPVCDDCQSPATTGGKCPKQYCKYDGIKLNSARVSRPFSFTVDKWGPGKSLEELIRLAFGAEVALKLNVVGQKTDWAECCDQTKSKQNVLSGQAGVQGEVSALFNVNGFGAVGRALFVAGLKAGVQGKLNTSGQFSAQYHDCPMKSPQEKERYDAQGTLGGALELNVKVGELGSFTVMGFAGAAGVEVQGQIISNRTPNEPNFDINSAINVYVQGDVVVLNQKVTGIRLQIPLIYNSQASVKVLFP